MKTNWTEQLQIISLFNENVSNGFLRSSARPEYSFMDEEAWCDTCNVLLEHYDENDTD